MQIFYLLFVTYHLLDLLCKRYLSTSTSSDDLRLSCCHTHRSGDQRAGGNVDVTDLPGAEATGGVSSSRYST